MVKLGGMVMEISSADFCKLTVQEVADLLLEKLDDQEVSRCKCFGCNGGRMFELSLCMKEVKE